jgi:hypothetical protein
MNVGYGSVGRKGESVEGKRASRQVPIDWIRKGREREKVGSREVEGTDDYGSEASLVLELLDEADNI